MSRVNHGRSRRRQRGAGKGKQFPVDSADGTRRHATTPASTRSPRWTSRRSTPRTPSPHDRRGRAVTSGRIRPPVRRSARAELDPHHRHPRRAGSSDRPDPRGGPQSRCRGGPALLQPRQPAGVPARPERRSRRRRFVHLAAKCQPPHHHLGQGGRRGVQSGDHPGPLARRRVRRGTSGRVSTEKVRERYRPDPSPCRPVPDSVD